MTPAPVLIDLFCCAGGAAKGYQRAGFYVVGVDIDPQPNYCGDVFVQMDALQFLAQLARNGYVQFTHRGEHLHVYRNDISAFHGSPPCQSSSALTKGNRKRAGWTDTHIDLIPETRDFFEHFGLPYVLENVQGSSLRRDLTLCGEMFGLGVIRHRYFELGRWNMEPPPHVPHRGRARGWRHGVFHEGPYFQVYGLGGGKGSVAEWQTAMGIDWTTDRRELAEAIPPAYTEFVGRHLMDALSSSAAA